VRIAFNRAIRRTPWGGGSQFLTVFADYLTAQGHEVVHSLAPNIDVIVMLDPRDEEGGFCANQIMVYKQRNADAKVLHRINDTGVTRGGESLDRLITNANAVLADRTVFISDWVRSPTGAMKRSSTLARRSRSQGSLSGSSRTTGATTRRRVSICTPRSIA
jgi:hypothetical protein